MSTKIGALWRREYTDKPSGAKRVFYSGDIEWPGVRGRIVLHLNDKKGNEKAPDLVLYYESIELPKEGKPAQDQDHGLETGEIPFDER